MFVVSEHDFGSVRACCFQFSSIQFNSVQGHSERSKRSRFQNTQVLFVWFVLNFTKPSQYIVRLVNSLNRRFKSKKAKGQSSK